MKFVKYLVGFLFTVISLKFSCQVNGDFRSVQTGVWNSSTTWETFNGTNWIVASSFPTSANGAITIMSGHVVTINASITIDQTTISNGGKLMLSAGTLTLNNGLGDDLMISGTYERTSPTTTISLNIGANVVCSNTGVYIHNSTGSSIPIVTWQDGSLLNIKNSVSTNLNQSFWNVLIEGGTATALSTDNTSKTMTVRNNFEQTGGDFYLKNGGSTGGTHTLDVNGNILHSGGIFGWNATNNQGETITNIYVGGNFTISGNASWGGFVSLNSCTSGVFFDGNNEQTFSTVLNQSGAVSKRFYVKQNHLGVHEIYNGTIQQTSISGTCSVTPPTGFSPWPTAGNTLKSFTINNSSGLPFQLQHSRNIDQNFYRTNGSIALLNGSVISYNLGASLHYNGIAAITTENAEFPTANGPTNLVINNAAGVTLHADRTLLGNLEFVQGLLNTGTCNSLTNNTMLVLGASSNVINAGQGKYVNGILRKIGNTVFTFTVGGNGQYAPVTISAPSNPTDHFTACYVNGDANIQGLNRNLREPSLGTISPCEYWNVNRTNGTSNVTITLDWDIQRGCSFLNSLNQLKVARWNGLIWEDRGNSLQQGSVNNGSVASLVSTNFGSFAISTQPNDMYASAVWIENCLTQNNGEFFNTTGTGADLINQDVGNTFQQNFGIHLNNSNSFVLRGAEVKSYKNNSSNICSASLKYRVYETNSTPGNFISLSLPFFSDCNTNQNNFFNGGELCAAGQQKWRAVVADGAISPFAPVDLTNLPPGNYSLQLYYELAGSNSLANSCDETFIYNNNGNYFNATFTIVQTPNLTVNQPASCGELGSFVITDLIANTEFKVTYLKNGSATDTLTYTSSSNGQIPIQNLTVGNYSEVTVLVNGCQIELPQSFSLNNPIFYPSFNSIPILCENSSAPLLEGTSINGITGTWTPSFIDTNTPGTFSHTFSPSAGQCAVDTTISVTITDKILPLFDSIPTICQYSAAPLLNGISNNGITGTWNPAIIDTISTGTTTYIYTPDGNQCAANDSIIVTVDSLITPEFSPFSNLCQNTTAPLLPGTSNNGISGSWEPSVIDINNSGSSIYTFTPSVDHCNAETTINIIVDPQITPIFSQIPDICENSNSPVLPTNSNNGITGTWTPSIIDSSLIGSTNYLFSPSIGQCATNSTLTVTVLSKIIPLFDSIPIICQYSAAPLLNGISNNAITGTWNPAIINTISTGATTYIFTPDGNQCAANDSMIITVDSLITPEFSPISNLCQNTTAPLLPGTSNNGISGSWEPSVIDINNSGSSIYTFTPSEEHCNAEKTINIIIDPQITPIFSQIPDICENSNSPVLPTNSNNGITGTWTPSIIDSSLIGSTNYLFSPSLGQCATSPSLTVTVLSKIIPLFDSIPTICQYSAAPLLNGTSNNEVIGEWFPAIINTEVAGIVTYEFTPGSELCATNSILTINILSEDDAICNLDIEIPEAFTPDDDNLNDLFEIKGIQNYLSNQLTIYNRWGNEVYFESGYKNEWDGTANRGIIVGDEKLPTSTYYYILDLYGDGKTTYKGYVFLKR